MTIHYRITYVIGGKLREYHTGVTRRYRLTNAGLTRIVAKQHNEWHNANVKARDVYLLRAMPGVLARDER